MAKQCPEHIKSALRLVAAFVEGLEEDPQVPTENSARHDLLADLTHRQVEVAEAFARGLDADETAKQLFISPHTVRNHAKAIYRKLGVHSQLELIQVLAAPTKCSGGCASHLEAAQELQTASERFDLFTEAVTEGVVITSAGRIVNADGAFPRMLGYAAEELVGQPLSLFCHPLDLSVLQKHAREGAAQSHRIRAVRRDGSTIHLQIEGRTAELDEQLVCVTRAADVSTLVRMEEEQHVNVERHRLAMRTMADGLWDMPFGECSHSVAPGLLELLGRSDSSGPPMLDAFADWSHEDDRLRVVAAIRSHLDDGEALDIECRLQAKDYTYRWLRIAATTLRRPSGEPYRQVGAYADITQEKQEALRREALLLHQTQQLEAVSRLAAGVAHDFNNTLAVIHGATAQAKMVASRLGEPDHLVINSCLSDIGTAVKRACLLTSQLQDLDRPDTGTGEKAFDLHPYSRELCHLYRWLVPAGIELECKLVETPAWIRANPILVEQILLNLVVNARDAMPEGGTLTVRSSLASYRDPGQQDPRPSVQISVSDTGCGMSAEVKKRAFETHFTTKDAGHGLGLATVARSVEEMGGSIEVESTLGVGTTFRVTLPLIREPARTGRAPTAVVRPAQRAPQFTK